MSLVDTHAITNDYQNVQLVSLRSWKNASEVSPRDQAGPYVILQKGYDPLDFTMAPDEFVLGRSGQWLTVGAFFRLPVEVRRKEFVYGTAAEVMTLMRDLPPKAAIMRGEAPAEPAPDAPQDDLNSAFAAAKAAPPASGADEVPSAG